MWRPDNWQNPYKYCPKEMLVDSPDYLDSDMHEAFEGGADAILDALISRPGTRRWGYHNNDGWLVFIPKEE